MSNLEFSKNIGEKLQKIIPELEGKFIEREEVVRIILLTIMSKCNAFLIGKPGVGKSYLLNRICSFVEEYTWYEKLFSSETLEKHVFGPEKHENDGTVTYVTRGMLPEANFGFGDEVFKSSKELQDSMLQVINEKKFKNGADIKNVPLYSFFGASNEFARQAESPFFDRLHFKYEVLDFADQDNFDTYMDGKFDKTDHISEKISLLDIDTVQTVSSVVSVSDTVRHARKQLRQAFQAFKIDVSPRTWGVIAHIWRISASLNGRSEVDFSDILLVKHICWSNYKEREETERITLGVLFGEKDAVKNIIKDCENKLLSCISSIKKDFLDILDYSRDLRGKDGEIVFNTTKIKLTDNIKELNKIKGELDSLLTHEQVNRDICMQIKNNIFLMPQRDPVFDEMIKNEIELLIQAAMEYIPQIKKWLNANSTVIEYQSSRFEARS